MVGCGGKNEPETISRPRAVATLALDEGTIACQMQLEGHSDGTVTLALPSAPFAMEAITCSPQVVTMDEQDGELRLGLEGKGEYRLDLSFTLSLPKEGAAYYAKHLYYVPDYLPRLVATPTDYTVTVTLPSEYVLVHAGDLTYRHYADGVQTRTYEIERASSLLLVAGTALVKAPIEGVAYYSTGDPLAELSARQIEQAADLFGTTWGQRRLDAVVALSDPTAYEGIAVVPPRESATSSAGVYSAASLYWKTLPVDDDAHPWVARSLTEYAVWYYYRSTDERAAYNLYLSAYRGATAYDYLSGNKPRLDLPLAAYDEEARSAILECKGFLMWYSLYQVAGERLNLALKALPLGKAMDDKAFVQALIERLGPEYATFFEAWLGGAVLLL